MFAMVNKHAHTHIHAYITTNSKNIHKTKEYLAHVVNCKLKV